MEQDNRSAATTPAMRKKNTAWHRWFRRTDVYIAEYILMLVVFSVFVGILVGLWFTFFQMIDARGVDARSMAQSTAMTLGALVVLAPSAYWLYARVTGQEMIQPELHRHRVRTVFLTFWMIGAVGAIIGLSVYVLSAVSSIVFAYTDNASSALVTQIIPGVLAVFTVTFAVFAVVKRATRRFAMISGIVLAVLATGLLIANVVMVVVKKDAPLPKNAFATCTFDRYVANKCSYDEYMKYLAQNPSDGGGGMMHTLDPSTYMGGGNTNMME